MSFTRTIISRASVDRLELLIEERLTESANRERIDRRIWNLFGEKWAVLYTDLSGFSRRVAEFGVIHFLQTIYESHRLLAPVIQYGNGILLKTEGDSLMVIYRHPDDAVRSAIAMQRACQRRSVALKPEDKVLLCIGIGYGDVLRISENEIFGAEVNAACKLGEDTAKAHEILITENVAHAIEMPPDTSLSALADAPPGASKAFRLDYPREA
jgi:class 3 adenylate cyclase